jgi:hypothetical protein
MRISRTLYFDSMGAGLVPIRVLSKHSEPLSPYLNTVRHEYEVKVTRDTPTNRPIYRKGETFRTSALWIGRKVIRNDGTLRILSVHVDDYIQEKNDE